MFLKTTKSKLDINQWNREYVDPIGSPKIDKEKNNILTKDIFLSMNNIRTGINGNVFVLGGSGTGKTYQFLAPNLMQANASYVITDPSGELYQRFGHFLEGEGYHVKCLYPENPEKSYFYNPLFYVETEEEVEELVDIILKNTQSEEEEKGIGTLYTKLTKEIMMVAIGVLLCLEKKRIFENMMRILRYALELVEGETISKLTLLVEHCYRNGQLGTKFYQMYQDFLRESDKMLPNIMVSVFARLQLFDDENIKNLTSKDNLHLDTIGDEKNAIFVILPTGNNGDSVIGSIFYTQILRILQNRYQNKDGIGRRLVLDSDGNVWKAVYGKNEEEANYLAEKYLLSTQDACIYYHKAMDWWEAKTKDGKYIGHRGTKEKMKEALKKLQGGCVAVGTRYRSPIPVRFMLDEFLNTTYIAGLAERLPILSFYGVSFTFCVKSFNVFKIRYHKIDEWELILGNCDAILYFGGCFVDNPSRLKEDECLLLVRGMPPYRGKKFHAIDHKNWCFVSEYRIKNGFYHFQTEKMVYLAPFETDELKESDTIDLTDINNKTEDQNIENNNVGLESTENVTKTSNTSSET